MTEQTNNARAWLAAGWLGLQSSWVQADIKDNLGTVVPAGDGCR